MGGVTATSYGNVPWPNQTSYKEPVVPSTCPNALAYNLFEQPQGMCTRTTIRDFPSDYKGKVDILCPNNRWKKVNYEDIHLLQERNLTDRLLAQLLKANLTVATMAKVAMEVRDSKGEELVEYILERAQEDPSLTETPGFLRYLMRIPRLLFGWFQTNQAPKSKIEKQESNDEIIATIPVGEEPLTHSGFRAELTQDGCGTLLHLQPVISGSATHFNTIERRHLSKADCVFLKQMGLTDYHLQEFVKNEIFTHEVMSVIHVLRAFKGNPLYEKIIDFAEEIPETKAFKKWVNDPSQGCSKKGKAYPKALILTSSYYLDRERQHAADLVADGKKYNPRAQDFPDLSFLKKLDTIYNLCRATFSSVDTFTAAIKKHSQDKSVKMLVIKTHGGQDYFKLSTYLQFTLDNRLDNDFPRSALSYLDPKAQVVFMSCEAGKGGNRERNLANFFYLNAPPGVTVVAPTDIYANFQVVSTRDAQGYIRVNFWNYELDAVMKEGVPFFKTIRDITYEINSSTKLLYSNGGSL